MKFELKPNPRGMSNDDLIREIKRVDNLLNKNTLTTDDFHKIARIHPTTLRNRFGSWRNALIAAGLEHKFVGLPDNIKIRRSTEIISDDKIISELKRIAKILGKESVTMEEFRKYSEIVIHPETVRRRFGGWVGLTQKAGLKLSSKYRRRYSNEEYFENLLNVWTHHGRQPFYREIEEYPSIISAGAYEGRFGSWRKALEAFVARMNQEDGKVEVVAKKEEIEQEQQINIKSGIDKVTKREKPRHKQQINIESRKHSVAVEDRHSIGLGLRFKVFSRDKFKCVKCGESPATVQTCKLHVDHIAPFSKGGKTVLENLQTLCEKCNLGKGNRHSE